MVRDPDLARPSPTRSRQDYLPAQIDVLRAVPDAVLTRAPLAIGGVLAEDADVRAWLGRRGVVYSARIRPSSERIGSVVAGRRAVRLRNYAAASIRDQALGASGTSWIARPITLRLPDGTRRTETLVCYWRDGAELAGAALTNERDPAQVLRLYEPARAAQRPSPELPWRPTSLRSARAWEHHLALVALLEAHRAGRRARDSN